MNSFKSPTRVADTGINGGEDAARLPPLKRASTPVRDPSSPTPQAAQFTTEMSRPLPNATDIRATWKFIQDGVELILTRLREGMSYNDYMQLYTVIYNFCTSSRMNTPATAPSLGATPGTGANLKGADLYTNLNMYFSAHLEGVFQGAIALSDDALLKYYTDEWSRYTTGAQYVNRLFTYLNRHWIKREKDEGRKHIYPVYTLALVSWRDHMFRHVQKMAGSSRNRLTEAVLNLIERQRNGELVDTTLVQRVVDSLVSLGIDENDTNRTNLDVYLAAFQQPFVEATRVYYTRESEAFLASNSVTDYMTKADARLKEEEDRVDMYLHPSSRKELITTCEEVLVKAHSEALQEEFQRLLDGEREEDLQRMYNLLFRIENGLDPLRARFEGHVKKAGLDAVERILDPAKESDPEPKAYVEALLTVHSKNNGLVMRAFKGETGFVASLDKACREFVNRNKACGTSSSKSPELLAKHANALLSKSNKSAEEDDLESSLSATMVAFKYIEDKDIFQKFYSKMLAKRLVFAASASDEAESNMISKLKDACGFEYTSKLQRMFSDIAVCKELNDQFKEQISHVSAEDKERYVDFNIQVLSTAAWPLHATDEAPTLPAELLKTRERFINFYNTKHSGRKLTWLWHLNRNEIRATYTNQKYIFTVSLYQAMVLLQFNHQGDSVTFEDLKAATNLEDKTLKGVLALLTKQKVIEFKDGDYELNLNYKNKKIRINLNQAIKSESKAETADVLKNVDEDRKHLIQAVIVRVMKSRKELKNQQLIQEAVAQLSTRFTPKVPDIKKQIEQLIDREYLERVEGQRDTFRYMA